LREPAENATFILSEAACGRPWPEGHTVVWTQAQAANPLPGSLTKKVRNIITHRHFLELFSRRIGRRLS
jgi:hypothetical protein